MEKVASNIILGIDFIRANKIVLDISSNQLTVLDRQLGWGESPPPAAQAELIGKEEGTNLEEEKDDPDNWILSRVSPPTVTNQQYDENIKGIINTYPRIIGSEDNIACYKKTRSS